MNRGTVWRRAGVPLDTAALFLFAALLIAPLFRIEYLNIWSSIESTFIADARFLKEHWPNPRWQPLWYLGTPFDFVYPPAVRYGTAAISKWSGVSPARAYHLYIALFYCFGIAGVYYLVRVGSGSRGAAWLAGVATALVSPSFLFMTAHRNDSLDWMPQRLWAMVRYGEGPHAAALAWLGWALAFAWRALDGRHPVMLALAVVFSAMVVSNNFYGATALAVFFPILVWSIFLERREPRIFGRAAAIAALSYGLTAFWLTPSYVRQTMENLQWVSRPSLGWSQVAAIAVMAAFAAASWMLAQRRPAWTVFVSGSLLFFGLHVLGERFLGLAIMGEPPRHIPELDVAMTLAIVTGLGWLWKRKWLWQRMAAALLVICGLATAGRYSLRPWRLYVQDRVYKSRVEYRMQDWVARNMPAARVMAAGSIRFWYDAWNDLAQVDGGAAQGLLNPITVPLRWELALREDPDKSALWLKAVGADAIIMSDESSQDEYHDYVYPTKFSGVLPILYDDSRGNVIHGVPRRYPAHARVVETARVAGFRPKTIDLDADDLREYVSILEEGPDAPIEMRWTGPDRFRIQARLGQGQSIVAQVSHHSRWEAGTARVRRDPLGFLWLHPGPGEHTIDVVFANRAENLICGLITCATLALLASYVGCGLWLRTAAPGPA